VHRAGEGAEQDDEGAQKVVTSYALKGASPNPVYKRYYDFLQESLRLRQELAQLEGLPPCPQPVAATPITGQYNSPFNDRSGYTGYRPFYYTPGYTPAPPAYNTPGYTSYPSYYNSPFYNAPVAPPPPVIGYSPFYNAPVYNAPWEGGGFYFGPTGSASFLQDSDLIKRIEPRTTDSLWSMPRSITGTSTNWASSYNLQTGLPNMDVAKQTRQGIVTQNICPSSTGAKDFIPSALSPRTGLLYIPAHNTCMDYEGLEVNYIAGTPYLGSSVRM